MHFFRTGPLVAKLASGSLSAQERAAYLLASYLVFNVAYYSGFVGTGTIPWTLPYLAEAGAVVLINIIGIVKTFDASGGSANRQYVIDFTCLYVPVSVVTLLVAWGTYWVLRIAFSSSLNALAVSDLQFAINISQLGFDMFTLVGFVTALGQLIATYAWLCTLLARVRAQRGDA